MFAPALIRLGHRLLGKVRPIEAFAHRTYELAPAHRRTAPPAIFAADCLDRVTGVCEDSSRQREWGRIRGGDRLHGPVVAWELRNATISRSFAYKGPLKHRIDNRREAYFALVPEGRVAEGVMSCTFCGGLYFGHSIRDDLPLTLLAESLGTPVRSSAPLFAHQHEYLQLTNLYAQPYDGATFDQLTIVDDHHQSLSRISRMREIRSRIRLLLPQPTHTGVFINRKGTGNPRRLANEDDVVALFASRGFAIVDPQLMSAIDILTHTSGARIVAGVEGSHLAHGIMSCADDCAFLVLQPPNRLNSVYKDFTDSMDMRYAFEVGEPVARDVFRMDLDSLSKMLDTLHAMGHGAANAGTDSLKQQQR
jgi:Glycosyltransferase 61